MQLDASTSSDPDQTSTSLTYLWDLDNDGIFGETGAGAIRGNETGQKPTFLVGDLNGVQAYVVRLRVIDAVNVQSNTTATINIANAAPVAGIAGPTDRTINQAGTFTFTATDPSTADKTAGFKYVIDWGDDSNPQTINSTTNNGNGVNVNHTYKYAGSYVISVTATDKDNAQSPAVTKLVTVSGAQLINDPSNTSRKTLLFGGTSGNDLMELKPGAAGAIAAFLNGVKLGEFKFTGFLIEVGEGGDDTIIVDQTLNFPRQIFGGEGNDRITTGLGADIISGGPGDDVISSGDGRDIIFGGTGKDSMDGGAEEDILIGGSTAFEAETDPTAIALAAIQSEWLRTTAYATRISHITGATTGGSNGSYFFKVSGTGQTVFDDLDIDTLTGGAGTDWYLFNTTGSGVFDTSDRDATETGTEF